MNKVERKKILFKKKFGTLHVKIVLNFRFVVISAQNTKIF